MHFVTNLFPIMTMRTLSKSVKICQSYWQKFAATFLCPTVYIRCMHLTCMHLIASNKIAAKVV